MRTLTLTLLALAALAAGALAAERALRTAPVPRAGITADAAGALFDLRNLRHGDRAERCVTVTNEGGEEARITVSGTSEAGDLAEHLRLSVTRGCDGGTLLFSGRLDEFREARDPSAAPAGERRRFGLAVEVAGEDDEVQGRRAVHAFAFAAEGTGSGVPLASSAVRAETQEQAAAPSTSPVCRTISFAQTGGHRRRPVLIKRHRVDRRVSAKLILRIYGAPGQQRLVLVTGLRVGRRVLPGRDYGRVAYRIGDGASVTSRVRPFRVRIAPGVLKPGRNVVHVTVTPKRGRAVRARYVLNIAAAQSGTTTTCEIG